MAVLVINITKYLSIVIALLHQIHEYLRREDSEGSKVLPPHGAWVIGAMAESDAVRRTRSRVERFKRYRL